MSCMSIASDELKVHISIVGFVIEILKEKLPY